MCVQITKALLYLNRSQIRKTGFNKHSTLLPLESLHKASGPFLGCHVERDARQLAVDIKGTLQLEEIPVLHDHLSLSSCHSMLDNEIYLLI